MYANNRSWPHLLFLRYTFLANLYETSEIWFVILTIESTNLGIYEKAHGRVQAKFLKSFIFSGEH